MNKYFIKVSALFLCFSLISSQTRLAVGQPLLFLNNAESKEFKQQQTDFKKKMEDLQKQAEFFANTNPAFGKNNHAANIAAAIEKEKNSITVRQDNTRVVLKNFPFEPIELKENKIISWAQNITEENGRGIVLLSLLKDKELLSRPEVYEKDSCSEGYEGETPCYFGLILESLPYVYFNYFEAETLTDFIIKQLKTPYDRDDKYYKVYYLYTLVAASLVSNNSTSSLMLERLLEGVKTGYPVTQVWVAKALSEIVYLKPFQQRKVMQELETLLQRYSDSLKFAYYEKSTIPGLKIPNQTMAIKNFMYSVCFFAAKEDDSIFKLLITTGSFVDRAAYLQNPLPGMDWDMLDKGAKFSKSQSGYKHEIAFNLIETLFSTYAMAERYDKMTNFIIKYATYKEGYGFLNYFLFAMLGLEFANAYNDILNIEGWTVQHKTFLAVLNEKVVELDPLVSDMVRNQMAAEVIAEWATFARVFKVVGKGLGLAGKTAVKYMPKAAFKSGQAWRAVSSKMPGIAKKAKWPAIVVGGGIASKAVYQKITSKSRPKVPEMSDENIRKAITVK
ncbi:hypothetical protein Emin_0319 [Elusimicrobium minutum Pei191]|uniref:Uncharacterized protein n=1 Tax=Elusimicrobium minutum (strain Pei191) TaxID=445932 RepID=B2KBX4_ELUMP|nr:hypothetical protein [Elusimicrobium minutum]ACC97878.1 hypothetical protein Emin_0319 [Elusimicrobium minutum Pei191]